MGEEIDRVLSGLVADPDCPEGVAEMLATQEEESPGFLKFLGLLTARIRNHPAQFNRLSLYTDKYDRQWYIVTNYDYRTYKWAISLGLEKEQLRVGASKLGFRCSALPLELIKKLEAKLDEQQREEVG